MLAVAEPVPAADTVLAVLPDRAARLAARDALLLARFPWASREVRDVLGTLPEARQQLLALRGRPEQIIRCKHWQECGMPLVLAYRREGPVYLFGADFQTFGHGEVRVGTTYCPACHGARRYTER